MEVFNAVDLVGRVDREGHPVETLPADDTHEAVGVVWLAGGPQQLPTQSG